MKIYYKFGFPSVAVLFIGFFSIISMGQKNLHDRQKRKLPLIFPPTAPTRIQWIVGIGIPLQDLVFEAMTTGYVLKAEYFLPSTVDQLRIRNPMKFQARKSSKTPKFEQFMVTESELLANVTEPLIIDRKSPIFRNYRWSIYKALEGLANRLKLNGRSCILKSICEAAETPFHGFNGIYGELLHILLTPSSSADTISEHADNEYFHAEHLGRSGANCYRIFKDCDTSLLSIFSDIHGMTDNILNLG